MTKITKRILAVALTGALLVPAVSAAQADPGRGWHHDRYPPVHRHDNAGAAVAAGIIGLAAGAILLGAASQPDYIEPPLYDYPPEPYPGRVSTGYQPWSPAWYDYCASKYRSFNPATGTYTTYRGEQRFCQ